MKSKKTVFAAVLALVLALSVFTVSAAAASAKVKKPGEAVNDPCIAAAAASGECVGQPLEGFVKGLRFLSEQERAALLADLAEIGKHEDRINEICSRMTDENAERLYAEIDAVDEKLTAVLERNAGLWERVNDEYDERIAANEPDMTLEPDEAELDDTCPAEASYEGSIKGMSSLTEKEKEVLLADLAEIGSLEAQIDELYYRMTDEDADRLYGEIDALCEKLDAILDRNAELWDRVDAEYDEKIAANEPDMAFVLSDNDFAVCEKIK